MIEDAPGWPVFWIPPVNAGGRILAGRLDLRIASKVGVRHPPHAAHRTRASYVVQMVRTRGAANEWSGHSVHCSPLDQRLRMTEPRTSAHRGFPVLDERCTFPSRSSAARFAVHVLPLNADDILIARSRQEDRQRRAPR
jgi:hypothetical protein